MDNIFAGIEGGGTTFVVTIARGSPTNIIETVEIPTTTPVETLDQTLKVLNRYTISAIGIANFGPLELCEQHERYGYITTSPKKKWQNFNLLGYFKSRFHVPIMIQTDVNAAALSEVSLGGHGDISSCSYITVGTGVGAGLVMSNTPVSGLSHPEGGHIKTSRFKGDDFEGTCPFHGDCIEGMVSAGAIASRLCISPDQLHTIPDDHPVWNIVGFYLGQLCATISLIASPQVIVLGGGVLKRTILYEHTRRHCLESLNGYVSSKVLCDTKSIEAYIKPSIFSNNAGAIGSVNLALQAYMK